MRRTSGIALHCIASRPQCHKYNQANQPNLQKGLFKMSAKDTVNTLALCGFGRAGKMHFTTIRQSHRCKLKYIVDVATQIDTINEFLKKYNFSHVQVLPSEEYETTVLADKEVQGVIVTTPTFAHEEYVSKALENGKGVFCEKPVAKTLSAVSKCYDVAAKAGLPLLCAFNRRFDDAFCSVKDQVQAGAIGKVHSIKTISRDSPLPSMEYLKISNGFFHDSSVHDIDVICWILGEDPIELYAQGNAHHPGIGGIQDIDTAAIVMKFPSGVIGMIDQSRHSSYGYDQRVEVSPIILHDYLLRQ